MWYNSHMQYTTGQIIRFIGDSTPLEIVGFEMDLLMTKREGTTKDGVHFAHPDQVELLEYECNVGKYRIGDEVRCMGLEGTATVVSFYQMRTTGEMMTTLRKEGAPDFLWNSNYCKRV